MKNLHFIAGKLVFVSSFERVDGKSMPDVVREFVPGLVMHKCVSQITFF